MQLLLVAHHGPHVDHYTGYLNFKNKKQVVNFEYENFYHLICLNENLVSFHFHQECQIVPEDCVGPLPLLASVRTKSSQAEEEK
ncbi:MAG: hypothetical protein QE271_03535 [Bacteriovoracaceae bacterium]|nr:hypothetical protein [Bacteriovoracaceae bacterium]